MTSAPAHSGSHSPNDFRTFLQEDWTRWLSEYPEIATVVGVAGCNDRWTDDSEAGIATRRTHLSDSMARLAGFDRERLSSEDQLNHDLYRDLLATAEEGVRIGFDPLPFDFGEPHDLRMPLNQMEGVHITASDLMELAPRDRLADYEDRIARLRALPAAVRQQQTLLEQGRVSGFTPPRVAVISVPDQIGSLAALEPDASPLLATFLHLPARIGPSDQTHLLAEARRAYSDGVLPAFTALHDYLVHRYLPACRETVGASALPGGPATYRFLVRRMTTTDLTPQQIHDIGLREIRRIRSEMEGIMKRVGYRGSFSEFKEFLRTDPQFYYSRVEDLLTSYRAIAKRADPELGRLFGRLPRLPYGVVPVPGFREKSSPAAYYMGGAPATGRPGNFYVNTYEVGVRPRWEMEGLTLHEAVPGHHLQIAIAQELDHLPEFRRWTGPTAFIEGWGLYAESLGEELGFYQDPYSKFGQLQFDAWRSARLVVDTGMHALGWTRDQAIQFCRENTAMSDIGIAVEIDRYIVWPAQALAYKIGQLKIREMRTFGESRLGERFDVRAFHDLVLGEGALPLHQLEVRARHWVDEAAAAPASSSPASA